MVSKYIAMAENNYGHIYLLQKREFIITNTSIYKVGRSQRIQKRLCSYANCLVIQVWFVNDVYQAENQVIQIMKGFFEQRKDIGNEYFEGDPFKMVDVINNITKDYRPSTATPEELAAEKERDIQYKKEIEKERAEFVKSCLTTCVTPDPHVNIVPLKEFRSHLMRMAKQKHLEYRIYCHRYIRYILHEHFDVDVFKADEQDMITIPISLHSHETPYTCPQCGYKTLSIDLMKRHFSPMCMCMTTAGGIKLNNVIKKFVLEHRVYKTGEK
jgi:hypothetical protein